MWKVIDLTVEQHQTQQQQQAKSVPWQQLQHVHNVNVGRRHYIGELS